MNKVQTIIKKSLPLLFLVIGVIIGWFFFAPSQSNVAEETKEKGMPQMYTCSMHPQIRQDKPGKCPLCAMDLIPVKVGGDIGDPDDIVLSKEALAIANVATIRAKKVKPVKLVSLYGKISADERSIQSQTAYVGGRIEELGVSFTGEQVSKGDYLATIYSPELYTAQQELLEAKVMKNETLIEAARNKLRLWKMSDLQIEEIEKSGKSTTNVRIYSNTQGIVTAKNISLGDYVSQGSVLYEISNLSKIWALFDVYEIDLPFLQKGDTVTFKLSAFPQEEFIGKIAFIDPILSSVTRTAKIRVEVENPHMKLKPEMYAKAVVKSSSKGLSEAIVIPQTAILWTGDRSLVYVKKDDPKEAIFSMREVLLGTYLGGEYIILSGLEEGEEIVAQGVFAIDASAQLEGKISMMNKEYESNEGKRETLGVRGNCSMCKERIEEAAKSVVGVYSAFWDVDEEILQLNINPDKTSVEMVSKAVSRVGHDTDLDRAPDSVYKSLHSCCLYRD